MLLRLRVAVPFLAFSVALLGLAPAPAAATSQPYVLNPGSSITRVCHGCGEAPAVPEALSGTFELTILPEKVRFTVVALSDLRLESESFVLRGNGFLQRIGRRRQAMVLDASVNGEPVVFTSGRRQNGLREEVRLILSSQPSDGVSYVIALYASPAGLNVIDLDGDGVDDRRDNCPTAFNPDQEQSDGDFVGDACDRCPGTGLRETADENGCGVAQLCPCDKQLSGEFWESQGQYLRCVATAARRLRDRGRITRSDAIQILRQQAKSSCGRTAVAHGGPVYLDNAGSQGTYVPLSVNADS